MRKRKTQIQRACLFCSRHSYLLPVRLCMRALTEDQTLHLLRSSKICCSRGLEILLRLLPNQRLLRHGLHRIHGHRGHLIHLIPMYHHLRQILPVLPGPLAHRDPRALRSQQLRRVVAAPGKSI